MKDEIEKLIVKWTKKSIALAVTPEQEDDDPLVYVDGFIRDLESLLKSERERDGNEKRNT